jgi:uncharacterized repeat protein (TIGR01451 family)
LTWNNSGILLSGDSTLLYIDANITDDVACVSPDYENIINLRYTEMGVEYTGQANYHFAVNSMPDVFLIKTADKSVVSSGDEITYTILYENTGERTLTGYSIVDYWPERIDFLSATPFPLSVINLST